MKITLHVEKQPLQIMRVNLIS